MPKANEIGTPTNTQAASSTMKNRIRLPKPIDTSAGCASHSPAAMAATVPTAAARLRSVAISSKRNRAMTAESTTPTSRASTRQPSVSGKLVSSTSACPL